MLPLDCGAQVNGCFVFHMLLIDLRLQGSGRVASFLERAGDGLVAGGKLGIFTPLYFFLVQKPE